MVEQRANLDYGRDDESVTEEHTTVEGNGFTMTDADDVVPARDVEVELDEDEPKVEAETLDAP